MIIKKNYDTKLEYLFNSFKPFEYFSLYDFSLRYLTTHNTFLKS